MISTLVDILNPTTDDTNRATTLLKEIDKASFTTPPLQHEFYQMHFNAVDLHDHYWYQLPYNYKVKSNCGKQFICFA